MFLIGLFDILSMIERVNEQHSEVKQNIDRIVSGGKKKIRDKKGTKKKKIK